jgi:hypothetical protein
VKFSEFATELLSTIGVEVGRERPSRPVACEKISVMASALGSLPTVSESSKLRSNIDPSSSRMRARLPHANGQGGAGNGGGAM